jgi:short-subunit dehydrogenase
LKLFCVQSFRTTSQLQKTLRQNEKLPITGASSGMFELAKIFAREGNDCIGSKKWLKLQELKNSLEKRIFNKSIIISKDLSKLIQPKKYMMK